MRPFTFFLGCVLASIIDGPVLTAAQAATSPSFSIDNATGDENLGQICFTIRKHGKINASPSQVLIYELAGTAKPGIDYIDQRTTIDFPAAAGNKVSCIGLVQNTDPEITKTFTAKLKAISNARLYDGTAIGTITDSDAIIPPTPVPPPPPQFSVRDMTFAENEGTVNVIVDKIGDNGLASVISYDVNPGHGMAVPGVDFVATSGQFTVAPGQNAFSIPVQIINDTTNEQPENFNVTVLGVSNAVVVRSGIITINDDDPVWVPPPPTGFPTGSLFHTTSACPAYSGSGSRVPDAGEQFTVITKGVGVTLTIPDGVPLLIGGQSVTHADFMYLFASCLAAG
jgi:hypothetical protein